MLQMQRLYTDMRTVSAQLSREPSLESVADQEHDTGGDPGPQTEDGCWLDEATALGSEPEVPDIRVVHDEMPVFGHLHRRKSMSTGNLAGFAKRLSTVTTSTTSDYGTEGGDTPDVVTQEICMCADCEESQLKELRAPSPARIRARSAEPRRRLSPTRLSVTSGRSASRLSLRMTNGDICFADDDCEEPVYV